MGKLKQTNIDKNAGVRTIEQIKEDLKVAEINRNRAVDKWAEACALYSKAEEAVANTRPAVQKYNSLVSSLQEELRSKINSSNEKV